MGATHDSRRQSMDWKLELIAIPVTDVDRAKAFYTEKVGLRRRPRPCRQRRDALRAADAARVGVLDRDRHRDHRVGARIGQGRSSSSRTSRPPEPSSSSAAPRSARCRSSRGARSCSSATRTGTAGRCSSSRRATSAATRACADGLGIGSAAEIVVGRGKLLAIGARFRPRELRRLRASPPPVRGAESTARRPKQAARIASRRARADPMPPRS